ncbi:MAG: TrmB family transcriptional regulator [archaeon]|nr:TrmB family transcriptional regulator [archaeon]MCP8314706.1 TrmB family transcriptional regulator [archaeon]MCP8315588.1 TrmB family transcriptional regulator [archaeon]
MESVVERLQKIGLTEYEAKAYLSLLKDHINTAAKLSEKSGIPRTRIYSVLESLEHKGWIRIYSGIPLLFKAIDPREVFKKVKKDYDEFLESIQATLKEEVKEMKEKFVILKFDVGLGSLKEEMRKAKTIWISNATRDFLEKMSDVFSKDAQVKVLLFPGERKIGNKNVQFKEAEVKIVCMVRNKEVASMSIILDESRTFTVFEDPVSHQYIVDEMLYDECSKCFTEWYNLGWNVAKEV